MIILGWILWMLVLVWVVFFAIAAIILHRKKRDLGLLLFRFFIVVGNGISLYIPIAYEISKFHLLWLVPVSFVIALIFLPFTAMLCARYSGKY